MKFLKCCGRICVVLDMLVLIPILALAPRTFPVDTHEVCEVLWAYLCSVVYAGANTNIWHKHHAHSQLTHMKFLICCGRICVVLDMLVLIPIFGTSTTHIPSGQT